MNWLILALISAVLSAIAAIAEKKSLFKIKPLEFSFWVSVFSFIFAIPFVLSFQMNSVSWQALLVLFVKSIFNAIAFFSVMMALKKLDISNSLPLMNLSPAIVAIFAFIFLRESLNIFEISGLGLLIIGTYILNTAQSKNVFAPFTMFIKSKAHNYILIALTCFSITSILDKVLVGNILKMPPEAFMFFQQAFTLLIFLVPVIIFRKKLNLELKESMKKSAVLIILVGLLTIGYRYTQILAVKTGKVALVLAVKRLSVFFSCVIGGTLFKDKNLARRIMATLILVIGVILLTSF